MSSNLALALGTNEELNMNLLKMIETVLLGLDA